MMDSVARLPSVPLTSQPTRSAGRPRTLSSIKRRRAAFDGAITSIKTARQGRLHRAGARRFHALEPHHSVNVSLHPTRSDAGRRNEGHWAVAARHGAVKPSGIARVRRRGIARVFHSLPFQQRAWDQRDTNLEFDSLLE